MEEKFEEQLDRNKLFVVKYGLIIIILTLGILLILLASLSIGGISILHSALNYYLN
jgi:hypothetical protein